MTFIRNILTLACLLTTTLVFGQDYHFSQFYSSPLAFNPALTGNFAGDYRISAIYRNQWNGINSKFETSALGADMNFKGGVLKKDMIGVGLYAYRDDLGDNIFLAQSIALSGAYHHYLDVYKRHRLSGGVQVTFVQKSVNPEKLIFADQFEDYEFVPELATGDAFTHTKINYVTLNLGIAYSFIITPKTDVYTGLTVFQANTPKESFYSGSNRLNRRYANLSGMNYKLSDKVTISPKVLYMNQEKSQDINAGLEAGYRVGIKRHTTLYAGGWLRMSDAAIIMAGAKWKNYTLRLSYDATVSGVKKIKSASNIKSNPKTGAFELSFIMIGKLSRPIPDSFTIPCGIY
jgi:type IX secretion system PorP/SprF family membrane protein